MTVDGTGGEVSLNGCFLGDTGSPNAGLINGNVKVSLRNVSWGFAAEILFSKLHRNDHQLFIYNSLSPWQRCRRIQLMD